MKLKLKVIKKNQLAILVISLMLITAGYLNYQTNYPEEEAKTANAELKESINIASLGDAELVNTDVTEEKKEEQVEEKKEEEIKKEEPKETSVDTADDYFTKSKLERSVMYSQMIERYQGIISSNSQNQEQKGIATQEINKINSLENAIMIAENLLTTKGFTKNIIFVNGDSVNIVIGKDPLSPEEVAQIQNIISRELLVELQNIHISTK